MLGTVLVTVAPATMEVVEVKTYVAMTCLVVEVASIYLFAVGSIAINTRIIELCVNHLGQFIDFVLKERFLLFWIKLNL